MITYLNDMFGMDIGYFQWIIYCAPFVLIMIPLTWLVVNMRFKPQINSLAPSMNQLKTEISNGHDLCDYGIRLADRTNFL